VVFDKTGTLSSDAQQLDSTQCRPGLSADEALGMAAALASHSRHPAARALCEAAQASAQLGVWQAMEVQETAGQGLSGLAPKPMRLGSAAFCGLADAQSDGSSVFLTDELGWMATFHLREVLRTDARKCVQDLQALGLAVHLLSGDAPAPVALAAAQLGITPDRAHARCTPDDKLARLRQLQAQGATVAMVGDGMNDAPVLATGSILAYTENGEAVAINTVITVADVELPAGVFTEMDPGAPVVPGAATRFSVESDHEEGNEPEAAASDEEAPAEDAAADEDSADEAGSDEAAGE
jgi:Cu2+-exporting ATPase